MKNRRILKVVLIVIVMAIICIALAGCDKTHAVLEVTTSDGGSGNFTTYNDSDGAGIYSGQHLARDNMIEVKLLKGQTATMHFYCETCGHDEEVTLEVPFSKMFACDCGSSNNAKKEYRSIIGYVVE